MYKYAQLLLGSFFTFISFATFAQNETPNRALPYDYSIYQKFNKNVYDVHSKFHSSIKDFYIDNPLLTSTYDSLMNYGIDSNVYRSWWRRKLTQEHLIQIKNPDYEVNIDVLGELSLGKDFKGNRGLWQSSRGFQVEGKVGNQFSFYLNGLENQGQFADYLHQYINTNQVVPGQGFGKLGKNTQDWTYVTANLSYTPNKYLNFVLGYDKNFIGDGYRSVLLSDVSSNYSFFRMRASLGSVQYQTIYAYMLDPGAPKLATGRRLGDRGKWMAAHYVDWNATNRFSIGFFQAVTWADAEVEGKRGFDLNYIHPFIFLRSVESTNSTSPDKMRLGFNAKYEISPNITAYGQYMFDELTLKEFFSNKGYWANKFAFQLGIRGADLFNVERLNYLVEFNSVKPYTYAHFNRLSNYSNYNESLAHPLGANFRELLGIFNYSYKRFQFSWEAQWARYGLDPAGENYGKDIFKDYNTHVSTYGNFTGQGIKTNLNNQFVKVAYLINPKYNLRLEVGAQYRSEKNENFHHQTGAVTFGLKTGFRNLYHDF